MAGSRSIAANAKQLPGLAVSDSFNVIRHERRDWFKWITGKNEDLAEAQITAPSPVPQTLSDDDILTAPDIQNGATHVA